MVTEPLQVKNVDIEHVLDPEASLADELKVKFELESSLTTISGVTVKCQTYAKKAGSVIDTFDSFRVPPPPKFVDGNVVLSIATPLRSNNLYAN